MIWILGVCLIAATVIVACEEMEMKENNGKTDKKLALTPIQAGAVAMNVLEIDKQITWIAKGLAFSEWKTPGLNKVVYDEAILNEFWEEELADAHGNSNALINYDLQVEHHNEVQNNIPGNFYDIKFFPGFEYNNNNFFTICYIPDCDSIDTLQQHIFVPKRELIQPPSRHITGFYINNSGFLDSVDLDFNSAPTQNYYIWIIDYNINPSMLMTSRNYDEQFPAGYCGDGVCDRDGVLGPPEDENCTDCQDDLGQPKPGDKIYDVYLYSIFIDDDREYDCKGSNNENGLEHWLSGDYEFCFGGAIIRNNEIFDNLGANCGTGNGLMGLWSIPRSNACFKYDTPYPWCNDKSDNCTSASEKIINTYVLRGAIEGDQLFLAIGEYDIPAKCYDGIMHNSTGIICDGQPSLIVEFEKLICQNPKRTTGCSIPALISNSSQDEFYIYSSDIQNVNSFITNELELDGDRFIVTYKLIPLN